MLYGFSESQAMSEFGMVMGMAFPLIMIPGTLISSLAVALVPEISSKTSNIDDKSSTRDFEGLVSHVNLALNVSLAITMIFVPAFIVLGTPICEILFGSTGAGIYVSRAAIIMIPMGISQITSSLLNSMGLEIKSLINSVYSMDPEKLLKMLSSNEKGIEELSSSITKAAKLYEENKELISVLKKYLTEENVEKLKKLTADLSEADLAQYKELLSNPLFKRFFKDLPKLAEDLEDVMPIVEALEKDLDDPEVKASLDKLPETLTELNDIIGTISDNQELIDSLLELTSDNNMSKISDILDAVNKYDISSMISEYTKIADNAKDVSAKLEAMISLGGEYKIFTSAESDMKTTTAFVFNTPSIK